MSPDISKWTLDKLWCPEKELATGFNSMHGMYWEDVCRAGCAHLCHLSQAFTPPLSKEGVTHPMHCPNPGGLSHCQAGP